MHRRFVICFRDVGIHIITASKTLHSSKKNAFVVLSQLRNTENAKQSFLTL